MRYFVFILLFFTHSCQNADKNIELEVIKSTMIELLGNRNYQLAPPPPPPKAFLPDSSELIVESAIGVFSDGVLVTSDSLVKADSITSALEQRRWFDSVTQAYYTFDWQQYRKDSIEWAKTFKTVKSSEKIILTIHDSLLSNKGGAISEVSNLGFRKDFEVNLTEEYLNLLEQLKDSSLKSIQIDFGELTNLGKYKIEKEGYEPNSNERIASLFIFSRVVLNSDQTKAVYYFQEFQRRLDGYGYIVFAEWTAAGWKVIGKNMVWIS
jgi:hypothetical protein